MYKYFNVHNSNIDRGTVYFSLNTDIIDLEAYNSIFVFEKIKKLIKPAICKRNIMTAFWDFTNHCTVYCISVCTNK